MRRIRIEWRFWLYLFTAWIWMLAAAGTYFCDELNVVAAVYSGVGIFHLVIAGKFVHWCGEAVTEHREDESKSA